MGEAKTYIWDANASGGNFPFSGWSQTTRKGGKSLVSLSFLRKERHKWYHSILRQKICNPVAFQDVCTICGWLGALKRYFDCSQTHPEKNFLALPAATFALKLLLSNQGCVFCHSKSDGAIYFDMYAEIKKLKPMYMNFDRKDDFSTGIMTS